MARIRTVKPELFKHDELFQLEEESGLPMRIAWIGLFSVCDRAGRFHWRPRALKLEILPYDNLDFANVLDRFVAAGFVHKYEVEGKCYGVIPTFLIHQVPTTRENRSSLPPPPAQYCAKHVKSKADAAVRALASTDENDTDTVVARDEHSTEHVHVHAKDSTNTVPVHDEHSGERERERERELNNNICAKTRSPRNISDAAACAADSNFQEVYSEYPRKKGKLAGYKLFLKNIKSQLDYESLLTALEIFNKWHARNKTDPKYIPHFSTFMKTWTECLDPDWGADTPLVPAVTLEWDDPKNHDPSWDEPA